MDREKKVVKIIPKKVSAETPAYNLSEEQVNYYKDHGFLVIKGLIDYADLYNYKQHFIRMCKGLESTAHVTVVKEKSLVGKREKGEDYINKLQDVQFDEVFSTYLEHPRLLDAVAGLIGDDVTVINSMFINKPPGTAEHPPHQDLHYFPYRPVDKIIGTWTAVDDVSVENGCLWVVPGSHTAGTLYPHGYKPGAMKLYHGIHDESVAPAAVRVPLEMAPGDTVLFHPLLVHGSGANTSKMYRKCISGHYVNTTCEVVDVRGTSQAALALEVEREAARRGFPVGFAETWQMKSKVVRGKAKL